MARIRHERLRDPDALRALGLMKVRTGKKRDGHRVIFFCPKGIRRTGACVPQAILHFHR